MAKKFMMRPSSLYIFFAFFCFVFILIFYDGYRNIYYDANLMDGKDPAQSIAVHVEMARQLQYDKIINELAFIEDHSTLGAVGGLDKRHKLRWLYKSWEGKIYKAVAKVSVRWALYANYVHNALMVTIAFFFISLSVGRIRGTMNFETLGFLAFAVYAYVALVSTVPRIFDQHSFIEMAAIAAAVYFAITRRLLAFLVVAFFAVANRETGAAIGCIYAIINWRERLFWAPLFVAPVMLILINLDLFFLPELYDAGNFIAVGGDVGYINTSNLGSVPFSLIAFTAIKTFAFLAPIPILLPKVIKKLLGRRLLLIGAFYLFILLFGTILGNLLPYAMLIPVIFCLWAVAYPVAEFSSRQKI